MIIEHHGIDEQLTKLMEECGELIQAANKYRIAKGLEEQNKLIEEIQDVRIIADQLNGFINEFGTIAEVIREFKINREVERIEVQRQTAKND